MRHGFATIIIVTFNSSKVIEKCLRSFYEWNQSEFFEVIVVDNNSTDGTPDLVASMSFENLRVIRNKTNSGFGAAINRASHTASGEYLYLVNPDIFFTQPVLRPYLEFMSVRNDAAACTGILVAEDLKTVSMTMGAFPGNYSVIEDLGFHVLRRETYRRRLRVAQKPIRADFISGASVFIRRDLFESVDGFDERFFLYFEETDLFFRIARKKKMHPWVLPSIRVAHIGSSSSGINRDDSNLSTIFQQSKFYFFKKHYSPTVAHAVMCTDKVRKWIKSIALTR